MSKKINKNQIFSETSKGVGSAWVTWMPRLKQYKVQSFSYFSGEVTDDWGTHKIRKSRYPVENGRFTSKEQAIDTAKEVIVQMLECNAECYNL